MSSTKNGDENNNFAMNAGDGPLSYVKNSSYQRGTLEAAKLIIEEAISTKLEISSNGDSFCIADFGCSTGNNSFPAMQMIIDAVKRKHQSSDLKTPEFQVFFNDVVTNDFNTLFSSLPPNRNYHVAAVPGGFHRRLLPPSSIHFAYSSWALHWLTEVPKAVADAGSPAWNGGEIFYSRERKEVYDAYLDQFRRDMESFLNARAVEMVDGGLTAIVIPGAPAVWDPEKEFISASFAAAPLRSSLMDMAKRGKLSEAKIDTFNIPHYCPSLGELKEILESRSQRDFSIEKLEIIKNTAKNSYAIADAGAVIALVRAVYETMLAHHFGPQIIDELFQIYEEKVTTSPLFNNPNNDKTITILAILKKKTNIN